MILLVSQLHTLTRAFDAVADAYRLAVAEFLLVVHPDAGVCVVLEMGHVGGCCALSDDVGIRMDRVVVYRVGL